jgi:hypothetical protein
MSSEEQPKSDKNFNKIVAAICVAVIVIVGIGLLLRGGSDSSTTDASNQLQAGLSLSPASKDVTAGGDVDVTIWANSADQNVNAVQANFSYPTDQFEFVSIDDTNSAFGIDAQSAGSDGKVRIARGNTKPLSGNLQVAVVKLHAKAKTGPAKLNFTSGTALVSSAGNKDISEKTTGANYVIK